jgi:hypothetical protein
MEDLSVMTFPEREWKDIAKQLEKFGSCSSVRSCFELNKYKANQSYLTPWGDVIKIKKVTRYKKAEDIPTWKKMDKGMKISVRVGGRYGDNKWDYVEFEKNNY